MAEEASGRGEYDWSFYYSVYRFAYEIARAEKKTFADMRREEILNLIREVARALQPATSNQVR